MNYSKINLTKLKNYFKANLNIKLDKNKIKSILSTTKNDINKKFRTTFSSNPSFFELLQNKLEKTVDNSNTNQVALTQSTFWASAITWALMGGTAFAIGWIGIAKTDEIVIAQGKLEPKGGVIDVQMPLEGITKKVLVKEGQFVEKGQVLIQLDNEITEVRNSALQKNLDLNNQIMKKFTLLVEEGAISELQYLQQQIKVEEIISDLKTNQVTMQYQQIISPANGIVFELKPKGAGFVARSTEPVLKIVPMKNLIAKIEIDSRTIGFVKNGKSAEISIDSFPASDFGVIEGKVINIGSDALPPNPSEGKGYRFPADVILDEQYLTLKSGEKLNLQAGMSLTANIKLRKVSYLKLLLNKFSDKADSLRAI